MSRENELKEYNARLLQLARKWANSAFNPEELEDVCTEISSTLAEGMMVFERHVAELPEEEREAEAYRLEFMLPALTYLRRWQRVFTEDETSWHAE